MDRLEAIKRQLLDMLAAAPGGSKGELTREAWGALQAIARQHRLGPLLHRNAQAGKYANSIPEDVRKDWAAAFKQGALAAVAAQGTLLKLHSVLDDAGITYAVLKGARLAWHAHPHPALRLLRDIDILVSPEDARGAYAALMENGFERDISDKVPIDYALAHNKHLPGLLNSSAPYRVEVHTRVVEAATNKEMPTSQFQTPALLARRVWLPLGGANIPFLSDGDMLLHLIVHAAHDHRFNNGPQVLADIDALLGQANIDWQFLWQTAQENGWSQACFLLFALTQKYYGDQPIEWPADCQNAVSEKVLEASALLMLQDLELRGDLSVQLELSAGQAGGGRMGILKRLFPARHVVAAYAGRSIDTPLIWLFYPSWLATRLYRTLRGRLNQEQQTDLARARTVESWLSET